MAQSVFGGQLSSPVTGGMTISGRDAFWGVARAFGTAVVIASPIPGMPGSWIGKAKHGWRTGKAAIGGRTVSEAGELAFRYAAKHPVRSIGTAGGLAATWSEGVQRQFNPLYWQSQIVSDLPLGELVQTIYDSRRGGDLVLSSRSGPRPLDPRNPILVMRLQVPKIPLGRGGTPSNGKIISKHKRLPGVGTGRQNRRPQSPYCWVHRKQHWCRITRS